MRTHRDLWYRSGSHFLRFRSQKDYRLARMFTTRKRGLTSPTFGDTSDQWSAAVQIKTNPVFMDFAAPEWKDLGLQQKLVDAMLKVKLWKPLNTQAQVIPALLKGQTTMLTAEERSGKTLAYLLPTLARLMADKSWGAQKSLQQSPYALILTSAPSYSRQLVRVARDVVQLAELPVDAVDAVTGQWFRQPTKGTAPNCYILVATPESLLAKNPVSLRQLEEQLWHTKVVLVDELAHCLDTYRNDAFYRVMRILINGSDPFAVTQPDCKPNRGELPVLGNRDPQRFTTASFTNYRLLSPNIQGTPPSRQYVFCNSEPFSSPGLERRILERELGLTNVNYTTIPAQSTDRTAIHEIFLDIPQSKPVDRFDIVNRTLTSAILQVRRCQPPSTHRLILVWAEEQHVAEKFYQRFQAALDAFREEYTKWRTFHKLDTPSPTNVHLFNVRAELFIHRHNDPQIPDVKARLTATRFNDQPDYHPPELPMGTGPLTVVFLRALPYRQFEFPNVASIILTSMPQDIYSYLFWAGRTGRGTPYGEIITLVSPGDYFLAWFIRTHNAPTELTKPEQLTHVPIERPLTAPPALLKPFDPTNLTGVKKPFETTPSPDVFDWDL
ncbi:hypothetical protein IWQ62_002232 [Dispira parvispora]|uniref:ATP-dependent RNA helicase n=1 Tax=Dispira parvispora TaxID=1520584 RepID=A0A9W8AQF5_9FUNG|nr:hypothetical protein IWQ62_002232 [Dispira parvispora]